MFGIANRKQEIKEKEQELAAYQAALAKKEHMLGEMSLMWISADQRMLEIERQQRELEQQLKQVMSAACGIAGESEQQVERNQKLLQQVGEIAGKQEELRTGQRKSWKEPGETEDREPIDLTKIVAPITAELSHGMEEMRNMLDEVVELGKQMGVISLNAAVEAARAGSAGKGFAVVADEVRNLAGKSAEASKSTSELIEHSVRAVRTGTEIASHTADALMGIVDSMESVVSSIDRIAAVSGEQSNAVAQVTEGINQISDVVQNNSATAEESAAASEELSAEAEGLKKLVDQFTLAHD